MEKAKIYLIGDSTCHTNNLDTFPQIGWGQVFGCYINDSYEVINLAQNGRSSKSFIDEGWFQVVVNSIQKGDYLFIQFGHNDEKPDKPRHTEPFGSYQQNLSYFVNTARKVGATPVLCSSIYRRLFQEDKIHLVPNTHGDYPKAMEELAKKENVSFIDMNKLTKEKIESLGFEQSKELFMNFGPNLYPNYPEGKEDNSHMREKGARMVCSLLVDEMKKIDELKKLVK